MQRRNPAGSCLQTPLAPRWGQLSLPI
jgi:hypothetical protein